NLAYWRGRDYLGLGIGAVSTVSGVRNRNTPKLGAYLAALGHGSAPPREHEALSERTRREERLLLGLRLDEPLPLAPVRDALDPVGLERMEQLGLARRLGTGDAGQPGALTLTPRGRLLGGGVTADLLA